MEHTIFASLQTAFTQMWIEVIQFIPTLVIALVVLLVGAIIAASLKKIVERLFKRTGIDTALNTAGAGDLVQRAGFNLSAGTFIGTLVKWFVLIVFFIVALDILHLDAVTSFLEDVVIGYLPQVIVAVLILMVAVLVAGVVRKAVVASTQLAGMNRPELFGKVAYAAILIVAILAALNQLKVAVELIQPLFTGIIFAISLALGLAFGLGGKDAASRVIDSVTKH
jgi:hypothetical protein